MTTILSILKASVGMLIILLLCLLSRRIRVRKNNRAKYFPIPILTLIYTVTGMILIGKVLDFIDWIIDFSSEPII